MSLALSVIVIKHNCYVDACVMYFISGQKAVKQ